MSIQLHADTPVSIRPAMTDLVWIVVLTSLLHMAIPFLLQDTYTAYMLGDRAEHRLAKLTAVLAAPNFDSALAVIFDYGAPGDYLLFLPAHILGGHGFVVAQNIALHLFGLVYLYLLADRLFGRRTAIFVCAIYALLPASLFHPHTFSSEAISNPLLIAASFHAVCLLGEKRPALRDLALFCAFATIAIFVRNINGLLPVFVAFLFVVRHGAGVRALALAAGMIAGAFALPAGWAAADATIGARYPHNTVLNGFGSNLYWRAERFEALDGIALPEDIQQRQAMSLGEFIETVSARPGPYLKTVYADGINLIANSGVNMVFGRFFRLYDPDDGSNSSMVVWRDIRTNEGYLAAIKAMASVAPGAMVANVAALGIHLALLLISGLAALGYLVRGAAPLAVRMYLAGLPVYFLVFSFIASAVRWDMRSPAEFVIALFAAVAITGIVRKNQRSGAPGRDPSPYRYG